ncbi:MAG: NifU family protein [Actinobacteria bacterium]|nr:NifU family protein [Actinomycetota bacterium]
MDDTAAPTTDDTSADATEKVSPFASTPAAEHGAVPLKVSEAALHKVLDILSAEDEPEKLALRVEVVGINGAEYSYDVSFEESATTEEVLRYQQGDLPVMIPVESVDSLWGATLDLPSTPGQGGLVIRNPNRPDPLTAYDVDLSGTVRERLEQLLAQMINPGLASHGGFAELVDVIDEDTKAVITMGGGCQGCAVSAMTLREGIQKSILEHIPEITEVVDATDHEAGENPYYT